MLKRDFVPQAPLFASPRTGLVAEIALAEVEALPHRLQDARAIRSEIEPAAENQMEGRAGERELPVLDRAEIGTVLGVLGLVLAQHENVPAVERPEVGLDIVLPRVRRPAPEYEEVLAGIEGRSDRRRIAVGGEREIALVGPDLLEDVVDAYVVDDSVVGATPLPGLKRQRRRRGDRHDVEDAERAEVDDRQAQLLARQQPACEDEEEGHEAEHP